MNSPSSGMSQRLSLARIAMCPSRSCRRLWRRARGRGSPSRRRAASRAAVPTDPSRRARPCQGRRRARAESARVVLSQKRGEDRAYCRSRTMPIPTGVKIGYRATNFDAGWRKCASIAADGIPSWGVGSTFGLAGRGRTRPRGHPDRHLDDRRYVGERRSDTRPPRLRHRPSRSRSSPAKRQTTSSDSGISSTRRVSC